MGSESAILEPALPPAEIYSEESAWLAARRSGIGASQAAAAMGANRYETALRLFAEKTGRLAPEDLSENISVLMGKLLEEPNSSLFAKDTGAKLYDPGRFTIYRSTDRPWMFATLDRLILPPFPGQEGPGVLECKVTALTPDEVGDGEIEHLIQVQHQLAVTGLRWGALSYLHIGFGKKYRWIPIARDDRFITKALIPRLEEFMDLIRRDVPPAPSSEDAQTLAELYPRQVPAKSIELTADALGGMEPTLLAGEVEKLSNQIKDFEAEKERLRNLVRAAMGDAEFGVVAGGGRWSWKTQRGNFAWKDWWEGLGVERQAALPPVPQPEHRHLRFAKKK